jgi:hypothetical protein
MTLTDDEDELPPPRRAEPKPRAGGKAVPRQNSRAEMRKAFFKFGIGCLLTLIMGAIFLKFNILSASAALIAVAVQVTALVVYFATSDIMRSYHVKEGKAPQRDVIGPERRASRRRTGLRFVTGLVLVFLAAACFQRYGVLGYAPPWKITDPSSKLFNAQNFRFSDYRTPKEIDRAARLVFLPGTPKTAVDQILHDRAHAAVKLYDQGMSSKVFCYTYSSSASRGFLTGVFAWVFNNTEADKLWFIFVRYDANSKVTGVSGTVQLDQTGSLPYDQMTPTSSPAPYAAQTPYPLK